MKKRVLIADDHAFVSWGIAKALIAWDEVEIVGTANNDIDAIVEVRKPRPDDAILDYNMPGANGLEVFLESKMLVVGRALRSFYRYRFGGNDPLLKTTVDSHRINPTRSFAVNSTAILRAAVWAGLLDPASIRRESREIPPNRSGYRANSGDRLMFRPGDFR